ncbi:PIN domain-containing protein [uncultured Thiodictyon sp.]|jgi:predicted nucleic acid-binding protein|uniref:type II toxin-antitoxin system VapC family toxin n=1 Tax=uncultured Thiodictyon sp. TaxID=1846217 RepID=UPI0025DE7A0C|nr:PIN domain-containing protein [uncultured Thiodictyon sp.]
MRRLFADTFYWIAVLNPRDQAHARAIALSKMLQPAQIITTDEVLIEFLNYFAERGDFQRRAAARMVERMHADRTLHVLPQTRDGFLTGLRLYRARPDKGYSLTDCISMEMMRREGLTEVLTDDAHFAQEGFVCLLSD